MLEDNSTAASATGADAFTVFCYNILAEKYATPQMYGYTPSWALAWEYRKELILQEVLAYSADVVCLQVIAHFFTLTLLRVTRVIFYISTHLFECGNDRKSNLDNTTTTSKIK